MFFVARIATNSDSEQVRVNIFDVHAIAVDLGYIFCKFAGVHDCHQGWGYAKPPLWPSNLPRPPVPVVCGGQPHGGAVGSDTKMALGVVAGAETLKMANNDPGHGSACFRAEDTSVDFNASTAELDPIGEPVAAEADALAAVAVAVCTKLGEGLKTAEDPVSKGDAGGRVGDHGDNKSWARRLH